MADKKPAPTSKPSATGSAKGAPQFAPSKPVAAVPGKPGKAVSAEQRWKLVAEAAYYIAEKRGFAPGNSVADWLAAERQVDAKLRS